MHDSDQSPVVKSAEQFTSTARKPYQKPAFRQERLFETSALNCGKVQSTQGSCHNNRKTS